jgi:hypothetical protein
MKTIILLFSFIAILANNLFSQTFSGRPGVEKEIRIFCGSKTLANKPLWVVFSKGEIVLKADSIPFIDPNKIQSINIVKDSVSSKQYGALAKNGVIEITIDDKKHPKEYDRLKKLAEGN